MAASSTAGRPDRTGRPMRSLQRSCQVSSRPGSLYGRRKGLCRPPPHADIMRAFARFSYSHSDRRPMARKPPTKPRKNALQARSRATVDALVEATARILVREGFEKASTNRIAEIAGVSVGSLYQYFPSKEALVAAVIDRHNQEIMQVVGGTLAGIGTLPIAQAIRSLVTVA